MSNIETVRNPLKSDLKTIKAFIEGLGVENLEIEEVEADHNDHLRVWIDKGPGTVNAHRHLAVLFDPDGTVSVDRLEDGAGNEGDVIYSLDELREHIDWLLCESDDEIGEVLASGSFPYPFDLRDETYPKCFEWAWENVPGVKEMGDKAIPFAKRLAEVASFYLVAIPIVGMWGCMGVGDCVDQAQELTEGLFPESITGISDFDLIWRVAAEVAEQLRNDL